MKAQRLSWFGHVQRMPDTRTVKKLFNWKPLTKRSQGRPKYRWENNITQDICQIKIKNWIAWIQDRGKWKEFVEKAKTFNLEVQRLEDEEDSVHKSLRAKVAIACLKIEIFALTDCRGFCLRRNMSIVWMKSSRILVCVFIMLLISIHGKICTYRVIRKSIRDFRPLQYNSRDGHAEG
jgi:hypothetical protein